MSDGTITYPDPNVPWGVDAGLNHFHASFFQYVGPDSYAAGGTALAPGQIKLGTIESIPPAVGLPSDGLHTVLFVYNPTTDKIQAFWSAGSAAALVEVTDATNLSGYTAHFMALGRA